MPESLQVNIRNAHTHGLNQSYINFWKGDLGVFSDFPRSTGSEESTC